MQVRLIVVDGAKPAAFMLRLPTVIGRSADAKIKLPASTVSRHHCELYEYDGQLAVRDLDSSNGTVVNGHKIKGPTLLTEQDDLTIGPVTMRTICQPGADPAPASPGGEPTADTAPTAAEVAGSAKVDVRDDPRDEDSVLAYSENSTGSFIGIAPTADNSPTSDIADLPVFEGQDNEKTHIDADDSKLSSFLNGLDG